MSGSTNCPKGQGDLQWQIQKQMTTLLSLTLNQLQPMVKSKGLQCSLAKLKHVQRTSSSELSEVIS